MCGPMVIPLTMLAATALSATASVEQGQSAKAAANANANSERQTAISTENAGAQAAADQKTKARQIAAQGAAAAGAGGVDPTTGTPLTIEGQTAQFGELDSLRIINNASRTAWGYQAQAGITQFQGQQAQTASDLDAGSSLLGGASSAYFGGVKTGAWGTPGSSAGGGP